MITLTEGAAVLLNSKTLCQRAKTLSTAAYRRRQDAVATVTRSRIQQGRFRISGASDAAAVDHDSGTGQLAGVRVLFVDDNANVLIGIGSYLRHCGALVDTAQSGREALGRVPSARAQILLLDYSMPDMTGVELLANIRQMPGEAERPTPAILYTGLGHLRDTARAAGFSAYLIKPFNPRRLVEEIARLVGT
jgi:two-component system, chemotaxis family, chemotaxis protein CheY